MSAPYPDQNQNAYPNPAYQQQNQQMQSPYGTQPMPTQQMPGGENLKAAYYFIIYL